jgi:hypothetical protein
MCIFVPCASRQARVYFFLHISPIDNRQSRRSLSGMPCRHRLRFRLGALAPLGAIYLRSMSRISLPPAGTYLRCRPAEPVFLGPVEVCDWRGSLSRAPDVRPELVVLC